MATDMSIQGLNNTIEQKKKEYQRNVDTLKRQKDREKQNYDQQMQNLKNQKKYLADTKKKEANSPYASYVKTSNVVENLNREIELVLADFQG